MENLKIALLVPCYNATKYLPSFFNNIKQLNRKFDEIIFYNDGSTDKTKEILESSGYTFFSSDTNIGAACARNFLAEVSKSDFIHFHDVDDLMSYNYLDEVIKAINNNHEAEVITCDVDWVAFDTKESLIHWKYNNLELMKSPILYTLKNPIGGINTTFKRSTFLKINGFNTVFRIWEDADIHVRLALLGAKFYHIEETLCISIRYPNSLSSNQKYGWFCRFMYLKSYINSFPIDLTNEVYKEIEKCGYNLIVYNNWIKAKEAFDLVYKNQYSIPTTQNTIMSIIKSISPITAFFLKGVILKLLK